MVVIKFGGKNDLRCFLKIFCLHKKTNTNIELSQIFAPWKISWDLTNGPLSKLLELLDTQVYGVRSLGPVGDFLDSLQICEFFGGSYGL